MGARGQGEVYVQGAAGADDRETFAQCRLPFAMQTLWKGLQQKEVTSIHMTCTKQLQNIIISPPRKIYTHKKQLQNISNIAMTMLQKHRDILHATC